MKKSIIMGFIAVIFVACGDSTTIKKEPQASDRPNLPLTQEKENTPPSIPNI